MAKSKVTERDHGFVGLKRRMRAAQGHAVKVGVLGGKLKDGETSLTVAEVARTNEFGTSRIPSRPALRRAIETSRPQVRALARVGTQGIVSGTQTPEAALGRIGAYVQAEMQSSIVALRTPPNAPRTIEAKGSSNPLIDSGQYRQSISYEVVKNAAREAAERKAGRLA